MNKSIPYQMFWGNTSPLAFLSGAALLIIASDRLAHGIVAMGALVWVYCFSLLAVYAGIKIFPKRLRPVLIVFLASFIAGVYLLLLWILSPFCALETFFVIALVPMICMVSGIFKQIEVLDLSDSLSAACFEALSLGILIIIFALIREPFGFLSLSLPGGAQGSILLFFSKTESFLPIRLIASSSGALLLLGYCTGLYRCFKAVYAPKEAK
jgi:hypothetical protein